jgi:hypothetical protein
MDIKEFLKNQIIYISGPISKDPNAKARFEKVQNHLEKVWTVINPFEIPGTKELDDRKATWEDYMKKDIAELVKVDFIYMLRGWRRSRGARIERKIAKALKIPILYQTKKQDKKTKQEEHK